MRRSACLDLVLFACVTTACAAPDPSAADDGDEVTVQLPTALGGGSDSTPLVPATPSSTRHAYGVTYVPPPSDDAPTFDVGFPASADISAEAPPPGDQGQTDSCTTWATAHTALGWWANQTGYGGTTFAPMYLYSQLAHGNCSTTSTIETVLGMIKSHGVDTQTDDEPMQYDLDCSTQPTAAQKTNAARFKISGYVQSSLSGGAQHAIEAVISSGQPAVLAINVYPEFDNASATSYLVGPPHSGDALSGGHAITAFAYDQNGVWILNSWGLGWGRNGWAELSWAFVNGKFNGNANVFDVVSVTGLELQVTDASSSCPVWAFTGQCQANPSYMLANCSFSCSDPWPSFTTPQSWFRIQNVALGSTYSLDTGVIAATGNYTGQYWMMTPLPNHYYRLTNMFQGSQKSFDTTQMAATGNYSGQEWYLMPITNGVYRLTNEYLGSNTSLAVNTTTRAIFSAASAEDSRQYWRVSLIQ